MLTSISYKFNYVTIIYLFSSDDNMHMSIRYISDVLPDSAIVNIADSSLSLKWALRYLVHVKCRGVLTTKGYVVCLTKKAL